MSVTGAPKVWERDCCILSHDNEGSSLLILGHNSCRTGVSEYAQGVLAGVVRVGGDLPLDRSRSKQRNGGVVSKQSFPTRQIATYS